MSLLQASSKIAILGGGLMGRLLSLALAQRGHAIDLYDAHGPQGDGAAARVAAAMLAPLAESAITEPGVVRMGQHGLKRWPELIAQLEQHVFLQQNGTLILWHRQDQGDAARFFGLLEKNRRINPSLPAMQEKTGAALQDCEPALQGRFNQAVYLPGEGQLDNRQLLTALVDKLTALGVQQHWESPREVGDFRPGEAGQPDFVFDCRGLGARTQWKQLRGIRGEVVRIHAPEVTLQRPTRLIHPRYPIYIAPKEDHLFVIGATEIESDDMSPASVRSTLELLSAAYTVHSGFAEGRIVEIATQCRPTLPDNLPAVRLLTPRVMEVNGLYRHGFMISPAMLDVVLELLDHDDSPLAREFDVAVHRG
ncbi:FAD-dependent oxidoreductase [Comamonas testosteroni]|nr:MULTISPECIES: FAD-dependent oxidoreductase [Comamonas]AIJ47748.1 glycine oxidase [Comamonas testosteroni TK102]MPS87441.1 FAD-dependent oxidoreductase [Comamonas sp.]TYK69018.1 FAD-dependent oxidoreductase [Comamonas sp. Z3]WQG64904.1 FAD-dependent oxidoreductase [Comamonas testosteroni]